jgi:chemosensory pili system protein ChpA (sensor histidine kinase/response regulator)
MAAERAATEGADAERIEAQKAEAQRMEAQKAEAQQAEAQKAEAQRTEAQRAEAPAETQRADQAERPEPEARRVAAAATEGQDSPDEALTSDADREAATVADVDERGRPLLTVDAEEDDEDEVDQRAGGTRTTVTTQELILAGRTDSLQAALASIALRIDALTSTTSTFRNLVSDRITDYAEQVGRLGNSAAADLDDYRHLHERAIDQIRRSVGDAEDNIRRLSRSVGDLDAKMAALIAAVRDSGDAIDQMSTERDQVSDGVVRSLERLEDGMSELTEGKGAASINRLSDLVSALVAERERQGAIWAEMQQVVVALADDRERGADVRVRLERAISDMTVGRERGLTKALSRLEARIDDVAAAVTGLSGDELNATLSRLDSRLREISTDLVVGRDREMARALGQVSTQIDELAALVADSRTDLSPIEARLNRLATSTPVPPPVDLSEVYARLDELAEMASQPPALDTGDLQNRLDELADSARTDGSWGAVIERLERLLPTLEGLRSAGGRGAASAAEDRDEVLGRLDQLGQQLADQLDGLRRRIALRGRGGGPALDDESIEAIADAVVARLNGGSSGPNPVLEAPPPAPALPRALPVGGGDASQRPRRVRDQWRDT